MASLTEQFDELMATHRLSSLSIARIGRSDDDAAFWSISAQGGGLSAGAPYDVVDLTEAVRIAIANLHVKRTPVVTVDDLAPMQVAA